MKSLGDRNCVAAGRSAVIYCSKTAPETSSTTRTQTDDPFGGVAMNRVTIFGPLLAVIYLGRHYLAFRDSARIETISQHFDFLVREAEVGARQMPAHLRALCDRVQ